jgi:putative ABC transport system permease protein
VVVYDGDSSWGSYQMLSGTWFHGPGEAVVPAEFLTATHTRVGDTITLTGNGQGASVRIVGTVFANQYQGLVIFTEESSLAALHPYVAPQSVQYDIDLKPGTDRGHYLDGLNAALRPYGILAQSGGGHTSSVVIAMDTLAGVLTIMLLAVAGLGVLNTVLLDTRERVHDLGVLKAVGMGPRQTLTMVVTSAAAVGLLGGAAGVPAGIALHDQVLPAIGAAAGTTIPHSDIAIYHLGLIIPLALGGLVIAVLGALLPAAWAARTTTAHVLRAE